MLERIEAIRARRRAAIGAARDSAELEELRIRYLGRKAELTAILRGSPTCRRSNGRPVGAAANQARQSLEELISRPARVGSTRPSSTRTCSPIGSTSPCPAPRRGRSAICT